MKKTVLRLCAGFAASICAAAVLVLNGSGPLADVTLFAVVCAALLAGAAAGDPDLSLAALALASGAAALWQLPGAWGEGPAPQWASALAASRWPGLVPLAMTALYLFLNRKSGVLKGFAVAAPALAGAAALIYPLLSLLGAENAGGFWASLSGALGGGARMALICRYLTLACCGAALFAGAGELSARRAQVRDLTAREAMLTESYDSMARSIKETSVLRHDWKNQVATLRLLAKRGDMDRLNRALEELDARLAGLSLRQFSQNFTVNVLLQNAAARAAQSGISFNALAPLPEELGIDGADLNSLLVNMLDNAVDSASRAPEGGREISVSLRLNQGFLAVSCENTRADGPEDGETPALRRMRLVAKKYGGVLDVTRAPGRLTVQTALNMR